MQAVSCQGIRIRDHIDASAVLNSEEAGYGGSATSITVLPQSGYAAYTQCKPASFSW